MWLKNTVNIFKVVYSKRHCPQYSLLLQTHLISLFSPLSEAVLEILFRVFRKGNKIYTEFCWEAPSNWSQAHKNLMVCPCLAPYLSNLARCKFWLIPKIKITTKGKGSESIQDTEVHRRELSELLQKVKRKQGKYVQSKGKHLKGD